jgi:DNA-binding transcriptional ArsR family regulator
LVTERREGRRVFYKLANPALSKWLLAGLEVLEKDAESSQVIKVSLRRARVAWSKSRTP